MKVAINGFGRIGRAVCRIALEKGINIVAINDIHGAEASAYLLKHDSIYGPYNKEISLKGNKLIVGEKRILVLGERDPIKLPWKKLGVDVVIESTGAFRNPKDALMHYHAGAKYVIVTAPCKENKPDLTIVPGVNDEKLKKSHKVISVASCTTNCLAPLVKILDNAFGIEKGFVTTVHAYTSSQSLVDSASQKLQRGRAAALNIVSTTTGATEAVSEVLPQIKGRLEGVALRVPIPSGSITDFSVLLKKKATVEQVNKLFKKHAVSNMKGILEYNEEPLVSSDIIGNPHSAIFNASDTKAIGDLIKIFAWYDNEFGYSNRVVDVLKMLRKWAR